MVGKVKSEKGSITVFMLLTLLFLLTAVIGVNTYINTNKQSVEMQYNKLKQVYQKDIGNEQEVYSKTIENNI